MAIELIILAALISIHLVGVEWYQPSQVDGVSRASLPYVNAGMQVSCKPHIIGASGGT